MAAGLGRSHTVASAMPLPRRHTCVSLGSHAVASAMAGTLLDYTYAFCIAVTSVTSPNSLEPSGTGTVGLGDTEAFKRHDTQWFFQTRALKHVCPPSCLDMHVWTSPAG